MSDTVRQITIECLRYDPERDREPRFQAWQLPYHEEMSVLQALQHIKDHLDGSLSFRWSCRMAICGSCGMMVNGMPTLVCHSFLRDYPGGRLRIEPLQHFPIVRDLVIDQSRFLADLQAVRPWLVPRQPAAPDAGPARQTPRQLEAFQPYAQCINCLLCYAACPQVAQDEGFVGPAALALLHRYNADARDMGWSARRDVANAQQGLWGCTLAGSCSEVCPKGVDPAHAINQNKLRGALDYLGLRRWLMPRGDGA